MKNIKEYMQYKGQEYAKFDKSRAKRIYTKLSPYLKLPPKTIQLLGTNGKGSTGRFLSLALMQNGFKILHFTSPHLFSFSERFYKNGTTISNEELEKAHLFLQQFDFMKECSYFEYATFLAATLAQDVDYFILEAGVGGEFDSTSVLKRDICVFSVIDFDHCEMLGESIEEIATTKLRAMTNQNIIGFQKYSCIKDIALKIAKDKKVELQFLSDISRNDVESYCKNHNLALFLKSNLALALKVIEVLGLKCDLSKLKALDLAGRYQKVACNLIVDVGHNENAAYAIKEQLKDTKVILVYNSYIQKDIKKILSILRENILRLEIIEIKNNERIIPKKDLIAIVESLGISYGDFVGLKKDFQYLAFGSFSVAESIMQSLQS